MAMGVVSEADLQAELAKVIQKERPGRNQGDKNVPEALRKVISETSITEGRQEAVALANMFGVSNSSTSAYARGATTTDAPINSNKALADSNKRVFGKIQKRAQSKLLIALDQIDETSIGNCDAVEASQVAKNLAGIIKDFSPDLKNPESGVSLQQQLVIYAPFIRREDEFPVINAYGE